MPGTLWNRPNRPSPLDSGRVRKLRLAGLGARGRNDQSRAADSPLKFRYGSYRLQRRSRESIALHGVCQYTYTRYCVAFVNPRIFAVLQDCNCEKCPNLLWISCPARVNRGFRDTCCPPRTVPQPTLDHQGGAGAGSEPPTEVRLRRGSVQGAGQVHAMWRSSLFRWKSPPGSEA